MHVKNEISYIYFFITIVFQQLNSVKVVEDNKKIVQFATVSTC
jgi:hypothetical protein